MTKKQLESCNISQLKELARGKVPIPARSNKADIIKLLLKYFRKQERNEYPSESSILKVTHSCTSREDDDDDNYEEDEYKDDDSQEKELKVSKCISLDEISVAIGNEKQQKTLTVSHGATSKGITNWIGFSVEDIKERMMDLLNLSSSDTYLMLVDGKEVSLSYIFEGKESRLEFLKAAGKKGNN